MTVNILSPMSKKKHQRNISSLLYEQNRIVSPAKHTASSWRHTRWFPINTICTRQCFNPKAQCLQVQYGKYDEAITTSYTTGKHCKTSACNVHNPLLNTAHNCMINTWSKVTSDCKYTTELHKQYSPTLGTQLPSMNSIHKTALIRSNSKYLYSSHIF